MLTQVNGLSLCLNNLKYPSKYVKTQAKMTFNASFLGLDKSLRPRLMSLTA